MPPSTTSSFGPWSHADRTDDRWESIESTTRSRLSYFDLRPATLPDSQQSFRQKFEELCRAHSIPNVQTLLCKVDASFYDIDSFIEAVNQATCRIRINYGFGGLVWGLCFAIFQSAFVLRGSSHGAVNPLAGKDGLVQVVTDLNTKLSRVDATCCQNGDYQDILQTIFEKYRDCCLNIIAICTKRTDLSWVSRLASPRACFDDTKRRLSEDIQLLPSSRYSSARGFIDAEQNTIQADQGPAQREMPGAFPSVPQLSDRQEIGRWMFKQGQRLGIGAFGEVIRVTRISDGKEFAKKVIRMQPGNDWPIFKNEVSKEYSVMERLQHPKNHPHVVTVHYCLEDPAHNAMEIYMTPVAEGNLEKILAGHHLQAEDIFPWFACLLEALDHCHKKSIRHKDIKPQNILVKGGVVYLTDFGLSRDFRGTSSQTNSRFAGTDEYQAPEYIWGEHGRSADVFSLGCVFSEMFTAAKNANLAEFKQCRRVIVAAERSHYEGLRDHEAVYCFHRSLSSVEQWLRSKSSAKSEDDKAIMEIIMGMLQSNPNQRWTVQQCLDRIRDRRALCCRCNDYRRDSGLSMGSYQG